MLQLYNQKQFSNHPKIQTLSIHGYPNLSNGTGHLWYLLPIRHPFG